jgi:hypothetical protein
VPLDEEAARKVFTGLRALFCASQQEEFSLKPENHASLDVGCIN